MYLVSLAVVGFAVTAQSPAGPPDSVALASMFSVAQFKQPDAVLWPAYFWLWNAPLDTAVLHKQLEDMAAHDARGVCMLPMPHGFRPDSTNNSMDPDYLTEEYFARVRDAVAEAARLGMNWWLYDEGGWPSGQALGKVVSGHPELAQQQVKRERVPATGPFTVPADALAVVVEQPSPRVIAPGETWTPSGAGDVAYVYRVVEGRAVDLLNPDATQRFIELTHEAYARAVSKYFGKTIRFTFTDEPAVVMPRPPDSMAWTPGLDQLFAAHGGGSVLERMPALFTAPSADIPASTAQARIYAYDTLTQRFADSYFGRLEEWDRRHSLASAGHLGGDDETFGAVKYGYGHLLRQLRHTDVPGVDLIWRQLFPGRPNQSNFPVAPASVAHQNGTRFAFSESFCVYGNGLTPAQMKWLVDYQYIRGINLLVMGCYPLSTQDHHMTGERPHFGPVNPLWDHLPGFHAYVARLGYVLSVGHPMIHTALYYPVRDMWAWGPGAKTAVDSYEALAAELLAHQCPYDLIDDDLLAAASVAGGKLSTGAMSYDTVVCGDVRWMHPDSLARLQHFAQSGGRVLCVDHVPGVEGKPGPTDPAPFVLGTPSGLAERVTPVVALSPANAGLRVAAREMNGKSIVVVFNEGESDYSGAMASDAAHVADMDLQCGTMTRLAAQDRRIALRMAPGETKAFLMSGDVVKAARKTSRVADSVTINELDIVAVAGMQMTVGEHDFEPIHQTFGDIPFARAAHWRDWLGPDYSGEVDYQTTLHVSAEWAESPLLLETGPIEYAATVYVDGKPVGRLLWPPWQVALPACKAGDHTLAIRVANTLANELTSERVVKLWASKKGAGWPSPYHARALEFEQESRGGGISGPFRVSRLVSR